MKAQLFIDPNYQFWTYACPQLICQAFTMFPCLLCLLEWHWIHTDYLSFQTYNWAMLSVAMIHGEYANMSEDGHKKLQVKLYNHLTINKKQHN